jgi:hypothetical protein
MNFFFKLWGKAGAENVVDTRPGFFSEQKSVEGFYCIAVEDHPALFFSYEDKETGEKVIVPSGFFEGFENLPLKTYDPKTGRFADFDPYSSDAIQHWFRRDHVIQPEITRRIKPGTEYKKIRRAMLAILDAMKDKKLEEHEDIIAFRAYSASIETFIGANPKTIKRDMREINGTKKKDKEGADGGL